MPYHRSRSPSVLCLVTLASLLAGCSSNRQSNTARTATEQLLISNAVDQSLNKIDFEPLAGANVFVEEKYIDSIDKGYIVGSIRHKLLQAGAYLAGKPEEADAIMELRSGAVGTDVSSSYLGVPGFTAPGMIGIPDIKLITHDSQRAVAKIGIVVYDVKSRRELGEGGVSTAQSDDTNSFYFGVGPKQSGTLQYEIKRSRAGHQVREIPSQVAIAQPSPPKVPPAQADTAKIKLSSGEKEKDEKPTEKDSKPAE